MKQYILLVHGNVKSQTTEEEWVEFFRLAQESGPFAGGSEIGAREVVGDIETKISTDHIVGFMRFDAENKQDVLDLSEKHPVVIHGGTVELCEMPCS